MRFTLILLIVFSLTGCSSKPVDISEATYENRAQSLNNTKMQGYKGIWFELNQKYEFGDKYSGALGTYTAKHTPLAIYAPEVQKTFFVFGGTLSEKERYLLCMIGEFDHGSGMLSQPTVVCDKGGVDDPHDNPSLMIDDEGFIWVFVSGRNISRPGYKFRSREKYSIEAFDLISEEEMTYPQPWNTDKGYFHFFTKYTGVRQLYFESSQDGINWTEDRLLAAIPEKTGGKSGHYQLSAVSKKGVLGTFFNRHPQGTVDIRTDLYYVQSSDLGKTWSSVDGSLLELPLVDKVSPARVLDYQSQQKNVYMKDMDFDEHGHPVCLYIRSRGHEPGPSSAPYEWCISRWTGKEWLSTVICSSDHNYDMGSLYLLEKEWLLVGPTEPGPQSWGVGGEIALWRSTDHGQNWEKTSQLTQGSDMSHSYVRRPLNFKAPFCFFWASGHAHVFSRSELFFGDFEGNIWKLPYHMSSPKEKPTRISDSLVDKPVIQDR